MLYSVTSTEKSGILQQCERYCNLGDAGITGSTTLLADFTNYSNRASREVWHWIFEAYGGWQYDDSNQTDLPSSATTLTADQTTYALPTDGITVKGVEVKDDGGIWHILTPITMEQIQDRQALGEFQKTSGTPRYYRLVGTTIQLYPASDWTQASSLKVFFDRGSVAFLTTDTTATPGFASEYHDLIPIMASLEWLKVKESNSATTQRLENDLVSKKRELQRFYQRKFSQQFPPRITTVDTTRYYL